MINENNQSMEDKIMRRVMNRGRGCAVIPADFLNLGSRDAVDQALSRLVNKEMLIRVDRGIYAYPEISEIVGPVVPSSEKIARAMARRGAQRLLPAGALAANLLGLSEQVPAQVEYLTDGSACERKTGNLTIRLKPTTPKNMATADRVTGPVIQALRYLGKNHVDAGVMQKLRNRLSYQ
jgi:hypothetical protein